MAGCGEPQSGGAWGEAWALQRGRAPFLGAQEERGGPPEEHPLQELSGSRAPATRVLGMGVSRPAARGGNRPLLLQRVPRPGTNSHPDFLGAHATAT